MTENQEKRPFYTRFFHGLQGPGSLKQKFMALSGTPHSIALGMAIGVFVSLTPTIPLHTVLCIGLAFLLRASKVAALMGSMLANPVTLPEFYYASYKLGSAIWRNPVAWNAHDLELHEIISKGWEFFAEMITGGLVMGIAPAVSTYFIIRWLVSAVRRNQQAQDAALANEKE